MNILSETADLLSTPFPSLAALSRAMQQELSPHLLLSSHQGQGTSTGSHTQRLCPIRDLGALSSVSACPKGLEEMGSKKALSEKEPSAEQCQGSLCQATLAQAHTQS